MDRKLSGRPLSSRRQQTLPSPEHVIDFLEEEHRGTRRLYEKIVKLGGDPADVKRILWQVLVALSFHGKRAELPLGMPRERIRRLPLELREIADKIEVLNESPVFSPAVFGMPAKLRESLPTEEHEPLGPGWYEVSRLPQVLRLYSEYVEGQLKVVRDLGRMNQWMTVDRHQFELIQLIKKETTQPRYELLAELLTAVHARVGLNDVVTADQLKTLYHRRRLSSDM